jgi:hypothetical protein
MGMAVALAACGSGSATGPSAASATPTSTPSATPTAAPTASASPTATVAPSPSAGGISFAGTASITGSVTASGSFTDTLDGTDADGRPYASCADYAADLIDGLPDTGVAFTTPGPQAIPGPQAPIPPAGTIEQAQLILDGTWPGPGVEGNGSGESTKGLTVSGNIFIEGASTEADFIDPATWLVDVKADGSGSMTFTDAQGTAGTVGTASGSVTWTCS